MLREDLWGMRLVIDLQQRHRHKLTLNSSEEEPRLWVLELTHRDGAPTNRIETWNLASAFATLLKAAEYDGFLDAFPEHLKE